MSGTLANKQMHGEKNGRCKDQTSSPVRCLLIQRDRFVLATSIPRLHKEESDVEGESMSTHTLSRKSANGRDLFKISEGDKKREQAHWMNQVCSSIRER